MAVAGSAAALLVALGAGLLDAGAPGASARVDVQPPRLEMSTFSGARSIRITTTLDADMLPVIVIRGPDAEVALNRKARVGLLWLNSGVVRVSGAPVVFMCYCTTPIEQLLAREEIDRYVLDAGAIRRQMRIAPSSADRPEIREAYVALRLEDQSYRFVDAGEGAVRSGPAPGTYSVVVPWSATARPAAYEIAVYGCRRGRVSEVTKVPLEVVRTGPTVWLARTAAANPPLYGAVAVGIALAVGFGVDFVATRLRRHRARRGAPAARVAGVH